MSGPLKYLPFALLFLLFVVSVGTALFLARAKVTKASYVGISEPIRCFPPVKVALRSNTPPVPAMPPQATPLPLVGDPLF